MATPKTIIYTGEYRHNRDAKGRLTIPSKWRPGGIEDDEYLALPNPTEGCVTVYPPRRAAKFIERMDQIGLADGDEQRALMELSAMAQSFSFDSQGRISLDDKLLKFAGIDSKEVVLLGNFNTFSIWSKDKYETAMTNDVAAQSAKLSTSLPKLGGI